MKKIFTLSCVVAMLAASLLVAQAGIIPIAAWNFENDAIAGYVPNPTPSTALTTAIASAIGMAAYTSGTNDPDVLLGVSGDTGGNTITNYTHTWRVRGQKSGNGWSSTAPIGAQGAQFNVDTRGFGGPINVTFDWYETAQGVGHMQLQYTTDNWTHTNNIAITIPTAEQTSLQNSNNSTGTDPNTVVGYYVSDNALISGTVAGADWFTNLTASITDPAATNNANFGIRIVNASTGAACLSASGTALNNTSGNWRFDNISVSGLAPTGPVLTPASNITADSNSFAISFPATPAWEANITSITVGGYSLPINSSTTNSTNIIFNMADGAAGNLFRTNASVTILVTATGYAADSVVQPIAPGVPTTWSITQQPAGPTGNGGTLVTNPVVSFLDTYGNVASTAFGSVTAATAGGTWSFGSGSGTTVPIVNGAATFTNLSATSAASVSSADITLTGSFGTLTTSTFNIPAPATSGFSPTNLVVFQEDVAAKNSTFSILEVNPVSGSVVHTFPISATGPNALRTSSAATTGRMSDSGDGSLVCFTGFETQDGSLVTTPDVTAVNPRGAGTLNASGSFTLQTTYTGDGTVSQNQTRSATSVDNQTWWMGDKGGVYTNAATGPVITVAGNNVRSIKNFGGVVYFLQQASGKVIQTPVSLIDPDSLTPVTLAGFMSESNDLDFYMVQSGANGSMYDTLYYIDGTAATSSTSPGGIFKYYFTGTYNDAGSPVWAPATGSPVVGTNYSGDGLCARTNAAGGIDLYFTTGSGGIAGNSLVTVHDSGATNVLSLGAVTTNYTVAATATLKGVAFAPIVLVTNVAFSPNVSSVAVSGTTNLATFVQILPANAVNPAVTCNSDNTAVATVNGSGVVRGVSPGTANIYVTTTDGSRLSATNTVTVTAPPVITPLLITSGSVIITGSGASAVASFSFTNAPYLTFSVHATNILTAPQPWPVISTVTDSGNGHYQFTDPNPATHAALYYILSQP